MASLLTHILQTHRLHARVRHLCSSGWGHLCGRNPPCQACDADWRTARWTNTYQYFEDQLLRACYKHKFHHSEWWTYFCLPEFPPGGSHRPPSEGPSRYSTTTQSRSSQLGGRSHKGQLPGSCSRCPSP